MEQIIPNNENYEYFDEDELNAWSSIEDSMEWGTLENLRGALDKKDSTTKTKDNKKSEITPSEKLLQDNQISRAVDLIKGINLFSNKVKKTSTAFINQSVNINENDTVRNQ